MRKNETNFSLITLQTNSLSISSFIGLMWWIHPTTLQHLQPSIPITSHLLGMESWVAATSPAQNVNEPSYLEVHCSIFTAGDHLCGDWANISWCVCQYNSIVLAEPSLPLGHQWALAAHDPVASSPPFFSRNISDTVGPVHCRRLHHHFPFIFWPNRCPFFQERLLFLIPNMRSYILSTPAGGVCDVRCYTFHFSPWKLRVNVLTCA